MGEGGHSVLKGFCLSRGLWEAVMVIVMVSLAFSVPSCVFDEEGGYIADVGEFTWQAKVNFTDLPISVTQAKIRCTESEAGLIVDIVRDQNDNTKGYASRSCTYPEVSKQTLYTASAEATWDSDGVACDFPVYDSPKVQPSCAIGAKPNGWIGPYESNITATLRYVGEYGTVRFKCHEDDGWHEEPFFESKASHICSYPHVKYGRTYTVRAERDYYEEGQLKTIGCDVAVLVSSPPGPFCSFPYNPTTGLSYELIGPKTQEITFYAWALPPYSYLDENTEFKVNMKCSDSDEGREVALTRTDYSVMGGCWWSWWDQYWWYDDGTWPSRLCPGPECPTCGYAKIQCEYPLVTHTTDYMISGVLSFPANEYYAKTSCSANGKVRDYPPNTPYCSLYSCLGGIWGELGGGGGEYGPFTTVVNATIRNLPEDYPNPALGDDIVNKPLNAMIWCDVEDPADMGVESVMTYVPNERLAWAARNCSYPQVNITKTYTARARIQNIPERIWYNFPNSECWKSIGIGDLALPQPSCVYYYPLNYYRYTPPYIGTGEFSVDTWVEIRDIPRQYSGKKLRINMTCYYYDEYKDEKLQSGEYTFTNSPIPAHPDDTVCNDGICNPKTTCGIGDCTFRDSGEIVEVIVPPATCGNGVCDSGMEFFENCTSCPADCPPCAECTPKNALVKPIYAKLRCTYPYVGTVVIEDPMDPNIEVKPVNFTTWANTSLEYLEELGIKFLPINCTGKVSDYPKVVYTPKPFCSIGANITTFSGEAVGRVMYKLYNIPNELKAEFNDPAKGIYAEINCTRGGTTELVRMVEFDPTNPSDPYYESNYGYMVWGLGDPNDVFHAVAVRDCTYPQVLAQAGFAPEGNATIRLPNEKNYVCRTTITDKPITCTMTAWPNAGWGTFDTNLYIQLNSEAPYSNAKLLVKCTPDDPGTEYSIPASSNLVHKCTIESPPFHRETRRASVWVSWQGGWAQICSTPITAKPLSVIETYKWAGPKDAWLFEDKQQKKVSEGAWFDMNLRAEAYFERITRSNIVLTIDTTASMRTVTEDKITYAVDAAKKFVNKTPNGNYLGVVSFRNCKASAVTPLVMATDDSKEYVEGVLDGLVDQTSGETNLGAALNASVKLVLGELGVGGYWSGLPAGFACTQTKPVMLAKKWNGLLLQQGGGPGCDYDCVCDAGESCPSCTDCLPCRRSECGGGPGTPCNNNGVCEPGLGETAMNCPGDCGGGGPGCDYDCVCDAGESCPSCTDCLPCRRSECGGGPGVVCGDGICSPTETPENCLKDCGFCGDAICDSAKEDCYNCQPDCGVLGCPEKDDNVTDNQKVIILLSDGGHNCGLEPYEKYCSTEYCYEQDGMLYCCKSTGFEPW
ncbi:MAG: vWA domain-containing protein, partial [Candidatus Micrarchaeia archaeon]